MVDLRTACAAYRRIQVAVNGEWRGGGSAGDEGTATVLTASLNGLVPYVTNNGLHRLIGRVLTAAEQFPFGALASKAGGLASASGAVSD